MGSIMENDEELFRNSIKFLHSVSNLPSLNVPALKSFYSTKGRLMELRKSMYLPSNVTRMSIKCQRCFLNLLDGPASYRIKSEQKKSKFARKLLAKSQVDKPMTKYQSEYFKRLDNFSGNHLAITCKFCKKESPIKLLKPERNIQSKVSAVLSKKRKNKKKDKFCGLNQEAVLSLTPQKSRNLNDSDVICVDDNKEPRFKLSKKENLGDKNVVINKGKITKAKNKLKKKKNLGKLSEFLNNSKKPKANSSSNLKHFLLGLES